MTDIYDITPPITAALAVWPGDTPPCREVLLDLRRGDNVTLSTLRATVHLGAHADGPNHYGVDAPSIAERSLNHYLGACRVIHVTVPRCSRVSVADVRLALQQAPAAAGSEPAIDGLPSRVLIATRTYPDPARWSPDFAAIDPDLVDWLHQHRVITVGIDTPSVDLFDSKDLPAHQRFLANDMAILEGLVLADVPAGDYELIALPLPLVGFDASPVRAVLRRPDAS